MVPLDRKIWNAFGLYTSLATNVTCHLKFYFIVDNSISVRLKGMKFSLPVACVYIIGRSSAFPLFILIIFIFPK